MLTICIIYIVVAAASIFGLVVASEKYGEIDNYWHAGWIMAGIFWPVALLPCAGYIAAMWYLNNFD